MARLFIGIIRVSTASGFEMRQLTHESQSAGEPKVLERRLNYRLDRGSPGKVVPADIEAKTSDRCSGVFVVMVRMGRDAAVAGAKVPAMDHDEAQRAVITVGQGRGFVVEAVRQRLVITAAHCLPDFPPSAAYSHLEERTYQDLSAPLGDFFNVWWSVSSPIRSAT